MQAYANKAYGGFTHARFESWAFKWLTSAFALSAAVVALANLQNFAALVCALVYVAVQGVIRAVKFSCTIPQRAARAAIRNSHNLVIVAIIWMATWFVGGADAAHAGLKIVNVCRAVQACRLESFEGEASCAMVDHGLHHGLPFHMPQCLDDDATLDLSTSLGLYAVAAPNASAMYSSHVRKPSATIP